MSNRLEHVWKWVVVFGAFMIHVICDGITYAFGLMQAELLESYDDGIALTSWIISILVGMTLGSGPIASALANHFGCRSVVIAGSIIASLGSLLSYFATGTVFLIFSVGIVMGFGFSLMFCPSVIIVNLYFKRKRALAVGIVVCGAGIGTFIFAPLSAYLIEQFAWRGTFLIYSGLILNGVAFAALFRLPMSSRSVIVAMDAPEPENGHVPTEDAFTRAKAKAAAFLNGNAPSPGTPPPMSFKATLGDLQEYSTSEAILPTNGFSRPDKSTVDKSLLTDRKRCFSVMSVDGFKEHRRRRHRTRTEVCDIYLPRRPLERRDIFYSGVILEEPEEAIAAPEVYDMDDTHLDPEKLVRSQEFAIEPKHPLGFGQSIVEGLKKLTDVSLLKDPVYLLIALSNFMTNMGYDLPRIFLPDKAEMEFGISELKASWLLSVWGIANTSGRVLVGYICDQKWAVHKRLWIYNISLCLGGLVNIASPLCTNYPMLVIYSALFGLSLSTYISLTSVVLVDLLGLDRLTNAFGLLLFFQGVGAVVGPPIGGLIVDTTKNYNHSFVFAGIILFLSGAILMPVAYLKKGHKKQSITNARIAA